MNYDNTGEIGIVNQEGQPVEMMFSVTHGRVQHYSDVVEHMVANAVQKYIETSKQNPSKEQVDFIRKEIVRYAVIRKDIEGAQKIKISERVLLG